MVLQVWYKHVHHQIYLLVGIKWYTYTTFLPFGKNKNILVEMLVTEMLVVQMLVATQRYNRIYTAVYTDPFEF